jgi:hypothetical protein
VPPLFINKPRATQAAAAQGCARPLTSRLVVLFPPSPPLFPEIAAQDVGEQLHWLMAYPEKAELLAVIASGTLLLLSRGGSGGGGAGAADGAWGVTLRAKCASGGGGGGGSGSGSGSGSSGAASLHVAWAAPHVLASASDREGAVRLFDLDSEENFTLQSDASQCDPWAATGGSGPSEQGGAPVRLTCLGSNQARSLVAAASSDGMVFVFGRRGTPGAVTSSSGGSSGQGAAEAAQNAGGDGDESQLWEQLHCFQVRLLVCFGHMDRLPCIWIALLRTHAGPCTASSSIDTTAPPSAQPSAPIRGLRPSPFRMLKSYKASHHNPSAGQRPAGANGVGPPARHAGSGLQRRGRGRGHKGAAAAQGRGRPGGGAGAREATRV